MKVTVAIAVFNVEDFIRKSVASVLNQDFESLEVLVVDDCSTDRSMEIVNEIASEHINGGKLKIIKHNKNLGTGATRNTCIANASGKYLLFLDGDDFIPQCAVSQLYTEMKNTNADFVMGQHAFVDMRGAILSSTNYKSGQISGDFSIAQWMRNNHTDYFPVALWNKLWDVDSLRRNKFEIVPWHRQEDLYFTFQVAFAAKKVSTIPQVTMYWVMRQRSAIHSEVTDFHYKQYLDIFSRCVLYLNNAKKAIPGNIPYELYYIITNRYLTGFITMNTVFSSKITHKEKADYLKKISSIRKIGIKRSQLISKKEKLVFVILKYRFRYPLFVISMKLISRLLLIRTKISLWLS